MDETERRRQIQIAYNERNGITPKSIEKAFKQTIGYEMAARKVVLEAASRDPNEGQKTQFLEELEREMHEAAAKLNFERAAQLRDRILEIRGETPPGAGDLSRPKSLTRKSLRKK
jgi:excinuclease ABC subunit B